MWQCVYIHTSIDVWGIRPYRRLNLAWLPDTRPTACAHLQSYVHLPEGIYGAFNQRRGHCPVVRPVIGYVWFCTIPTDRGLVRIQC